MQSQFKDLEVNKILRGNDPIWEKRNVRNNY